MKTKIILWTLAVAAMAVVGAGAQTVTTVLTNGLVLPHSVAATASGVYYITDGGGVLSNVRGSHAVMKYDPQNPGSGASLLAGNVNGNPGTNSGQGIFASFKLPAGIILARGGLVVADSGNHAIRYVGFDGTVTNIAGLPGTAGNVDANGTAARFNTPLGLSVDSNGNIFVADSVNSSIRMIDPLNNVTTYLGTGLRQPNAVAIGDNGDLWVADTLHQQIKLISTNGTVTTIAGDGNIGFTDAFPEAIATEFNSPRGLLWSGAQSGLIVADTGNDIIRRVFTNSATATYNVATSFGLHGQAGETDGTTNTATFNGPGGMAADPFNNGFVVIDQSGGALRRVQQSAPQPPVQDPEIGVVTLQKDSNNNVAAKLTPVINQTYANVPSIQVLGESGATYYYTFGPTPTNVFIDTIPDPTPNAFTAPAYQDGGAAVPVSMINSNSLVPDMTIKAIGIQNGRSPSKIVKARFQFVVANPVIVGDNAASFQVTSPSSGAQLYYTTDGTTLPTTNSTPVPTGGAISFNFPPNVNTNLTFIVEGFENGFASSAAVTNVFSSTNYSANHLTFGFAGGEGSSQFAASAGQTFYAPITMTTLTGQTMYGLQFNVTVTNIGAAPSVAPGAFYYTSMLTEPDPFVPGVQLYIPASFGVPGVLSNYTSTGTYNATITNATINLLEVGYVEIANGTNLYNASAQNLLTSSQAHETQFPNNAMPNQVIVGGYAFQVPSTAAPGQLYQIALGRPSADGDGFTSDVLLDAPTTGATNGPSPINAVKAVTVGSIAYIVGDAVPFRWFNAGDFGDGNLLNNDVVDVFRAAVYGLSTPPQGSDFFDAMDSSDGVFTGRTGQYDPNPDLNAIRYGDGFLEVDDVYVTFRRSLDPSLNWYARYWSNGVLQVTTVSNLFRGAPSQPAHSLTLQSVPKVSSGVQPSVSFSADDVIFTANQTVQVPIRANVAGDYPLRVLMIGLTVVPADGSPPLTVPVQFTPSNALGSPTINDSRGPGNYAATWLNSSIAGLSGSSIIGTLTVTLPAGTAPGSAYVVRFDHVSASPNGVSLLPKSVLNGLILGSDRSASSRADGIPDSWRLRYFYTIYSVESAATADPDGDGANNLAEFNAGTNPLDSGSMLQVKSVQSLSDSNGNPTGVSMNWPTVAGKYYVVECSISMKSGSWTQVSTVIPGTGSVMNFQTFSTAPGAQFYRIRLVDSSGN